MKEGDPGTIQRAEEIIYEASDRALGDAYERLEVVRHNPQCGCGNCKREAVRDMNQAVDFVSKGKDPVTWYVDDDGEIQYEMYNNKLDDLTP